MGLISLSLPIVGQANSTEEPKIATALTTLQTVINGNIDASNITDGAVTDVELASAFLDKVGVSSGSTVRRGKTNIVTTEGTTSASYTALATPDRVANVVLPTDGLIFIMFRAEVSATAGSSGVRIFLGSNAITNFDTGGIVGIDPWDGVANDFKTIWTDPSNASSLGFGSSGNATGPSTTGQMATAGAIPVFANAGTYTVEVRYANNSGASPGVQAKNRRLWVWTSAF